MNDDAIRAAAARIAAAGDSQPRAARDPVNLPMIRTWAEAIDPNGQDDPGTAPPSMIQVWTMPGLHGVRTDDDPLGQMSNLLDEAGYTSVVATNCDQTYQRYLKLGEQLSVRTRLLDVTGPKRTALGEGWFVTTRSTWFSSDEPVATMDFRILKFRPPEAPAPPAPAPEPPMLPLVTPDTAFFWDGTAAGELRIQRCATCGALRHPPGPMCPACGEAADGGYAVAAGTGEVFSYVVHHHPPVPGKTLPLVIALVQLEEGVRLLAEMPDISPDCVSIGMPVRIGFMRIDDELSLPVWRATEPPAGPRELPAVLPEMTVDVTATFVVAGALATRDFTPVHHDRDLAVANGSKDIFVNILTDNGLVQRFVSQWAGPQALLRQTSVRLGVPCYAGDTLTFTGRVTNRTAIPDGDRYEVQVTGRCSLGDHIIATAVIDVPERT